MLSRIANYLAGVGVDKYIHFNTCLFIAFVLSVALTFFASIWTATVIGCLATLGIGYLKEKMDQRKKGGSIDKQDMKADILGAIIGSMMSIL